jgi:hypothetical protein
VEDLKPKRRRRKGVLSGKPDFGTPDDDTADLDDLEE